MSNSSNGLSILIPCYNEEHGIATTLAAVERAAEDTGLPCEIIVVDDGSTDATVGHIDTDRCRLVRNERNLGYGASLKRAARLARYDTLVITDADGTYPIERLPDLVERLADADMVVGARTGSDAQIPPARRPAKWLLRTLANWLTGIQIPDLNSGLRVIRRELWTRFESYYPDGFSLTTTITLAALTNGYRVVYEPIDYRRRIGDSKIRPIRDTLAFIQLILRTVLYFDPLKVFVPLSLGLIALAVIVAVASKLAGRLMDVSTTVLFVTGLQMLMIGMLADLIVKRTK
jgi:glycosyltransferase involved in cell wall biosynthesis